MSAIVNLPLHHKVQKFSSGTGSPGWSRKKGRETVVLGGNVAQYNHRTRTRMTISTVHTSAMPRWCAECHSSSSILHSATVNLAQCH